MEPVELGAVQAALAGRWSLERVLGAGGMGTVFLAREVALDRPVAIKVLHPALASRAESRERFLREARTGARLTHPNIVPIYTVDEADGLVFFVMALVDGESLATRVQREGPVPPDEVERLLRDVCWGLGYAHAMGVVHRDVTLDNMLMERTTGRVMIADFGIASEVNAADAEMLLGTPGYLAPELIRGAGASEASDIFALGVSAWTLLAGRLPYAASDIAATLLQVLTEPVPSLAAAAPATPQRMVKGIERCLTAEPDARPPSVEAFLASLERPGTTTTLAAPLRRWVTRDARIRPAWAFALALVGMLSLQGFADAFTALSLLDILRVVARTGILVLLPTVALQAVFEFRELRLAQRAGYGIEDLRLAWQHHQSERTSAPAPLLGRVMHDLTVLALGAIVVLAQALRYGPILVSDWSGYLPFVSALADAARWCWIFLWTGIGAVVVLPVRAVRPSLRRGLAERFWNSRAGALMTRLAGVWLPRSHIPETTLHRPTELVLDLAIEELWVALPAESRSTLDDLPALAGALRRRIAECKAIRSRLSAPGRPEDPDTRALIIRFAERETEAITALEGLRLRLARLALDLAPASDFVQQLEAARQLELELLEELGGHPALRRRLAARPSPQATPSPTPA